MNQWGITKDRSHVSLSVAYVFNLVLTLVVFLKVNESVSCSVSYGSSFNILINFKCIN